MNDIIKNSVGKEARVFLKNGFTYLGKVTNCDEKFVEFLDYKTNSYRLIPLEEIKELVVGNG